MIVYAGNFGFIRRGRRPRRPGKNEKFVQNSVNKIMNLYKNSNQICYFARVVVVAKRREGLE